LEKINWKIIEKKAVVSQEWISQKLKMGDGSRVTQASRNVDTHNDSTLATLRERLEKVFINSWTTPYPYPPDTRVKS
jgi:hypothetical protein